MDFLAILVVDHSAAGQFGEVGLFEGGGRLLDVGCGGGWAVVQLAERFPDHTPAQLGQLAALTGVQLVWGTRVFPDRASYGVTLAFLVIALGQAVGLSEAAVRQRVQRLIDNSVMQVVAVTDPLPDWTTAPAFTATASALCSSRPARP